MTGGSLLVLKCSLSKILSKIYLYKQKTKKYSLKCFSVGSCIVLLVVSLVPQNIDTTMLAARVPNPRIVEVAPSNVTLKYSELPDCVAAAVAPLAQ
jgi:hypothetical protein